LSVQTGDGGGEFTQALFRNREIARLRADFPGFHIWQEQTAKGVQYVATRVREGLHPHTVVASDCDNLRRHLVDADSAPLTWLVGDRQGLGRA
jgi:hypothetical protein